MRYILSLLAVAASLEAATVTGTIQDALGNETTTRVQFYPLTAPLTNSGDLIVSGRSVNTTATNGVLNVSLQEGLYQVRIGGYDKIKISVPSGSGTYEIGTLTADGITYIPPGAGSSVSVASTLFVDASNGSDSTGTRGDLSKPYLSISNAIAAAQSGDTIVIRPGTYTIDAEAEYYSDDSSTITPTWYIQSKTNLTLVGYGARMVSSTYGHLLTIENSKNITIEGIEFSYPTNFIGSHGIAAAINHRKTNDLTTVRNCRFVNIADQAISHCWSQYGRPSTRWTITGNYYENIGIANHPALSNADGSLVSGRPQQLIFSGNRAAGINYGPMIEFDGAGGFAMTNKTLGEATITGNILEGIYKYGLVGISTATNSTYRLTVTGNVFKELESGYSANGVSLNLFYGVRDATISDNVYIAGARATTNAPVYGIAILKHPTAADPTLTLSTNVTITGNTFNGGTYGIWALNGVRGLNISGNTFKGQGWDSVLAWADGGLVANNLFLGAGAAGQTGAAMVHLWRNDSEQLDNVFINGNLFYDQETTPNTSYAVYLQPNGYGMTNVVLGNNMIHTLAAASTNYYLSTASIAPANFRGKVETDSQFWAEDGTTAYPGYAWSSNPDTGFYLSGANIVASIDGASEHWLRSAGFATAPDNLIGWYGEGYTDIDTRFVRSSQGIIGIVSSGATNALRFTEGNAPPTPSSGYGYMYVKGDGKPYFKDDAGTESAMLGTDHTGDVAIGGNLTVATNVNTGVGGGLYITDGTVYGGALKMGTSGLYPALYGTGSNIAAEWPSNGGQFAVLGSLSIGRPANSLDTFLSRDAANTLALRNGANSNSFRVYGGWGDSSNFSRASLAHDGTSTTTLAGETSGTGNDDQHIQAVTAGQGYFRHSNGSDTRFKSEGGTVSLTDATATTVGTISVASGAVYGAKLFYTIKAVSGSDLQVETGEVTVTGINVSGTITSATPSEVSSQVVSSGTLGTTWEVTQSGNTILVKCTADSSLSTPTITTTATWINSYGTITKP